ncbi:MAG: vanadium-dependent haloperoxidase [Cyclobacteriaceae bacterium]|nr:vanadium-dependent haloperoxidase [Cyclobacteriaceae bacterium]
MNRPLALVLLLLVLFGCSTEKVEYDKKVNDPEFLHRAIKQVTDRIVYDIFSPPVASRIYAYTSVAAYEAGRHADPQFISLSGQLNGLDSIPQPEAGKEYCYPLASVHAALIIGKTLVFSEDKMEEFYQKMMTDFKDAGLPDEVFDNSIEYGGKVATRILKWSSKDNYKQSRSFPKYTIQSDAGSWKPTPPGYIDAVEPHWNKIRTFVIDSAAQFRPAPAVTFSFDKKSQFFIEASEVYNIGVNLSDEQRQIASFWDCNPFVMNVRGHVMFSNKKISPGGHWMNITRVTCTMAKKDFVNSAEAYVRVALSLVDGFIVCWDEKYRSKVIRPETYINQYLDENWVPLLQTPPFPEYTSGHSVISMSAATTLTGLLGDNFAYTDSTETEFGLTARNFASFNQAAQEASVSRIYGGIHYRAAIENGMKQGKNVGDFIISHVKTRK